MASSPVGDNTVAIIQAVNQYATGLTGGYLVDLLMEQLPVDEDNFQLRVGRQLLQAALNGIALHYMIKFVHGSDPGPAYHDFTGGYMLAVGLIQSQPGFMKNGKELFTGLTSFIKDLYVPGNSLAAQVTDASTVADS